MGRILIAFGVFLIIAGLIVTLGERLPFGRLRLGRLPGDIVVRGKNSAFYFPLATCLIISAVLTLISWLLSRR